jgi:Reverse transcriptase (RNA-dependent DNA polymerase)
LKNILSLNFEDAKAFLLKHESYINVDLPQYIQCNHLLKNISIALAGRSYREVKTKNPDGLDNVNYKLLHNKNGKYDWRPFELIHPVLYVSLVQEITKYPNWKAIKKRFGEIRARSAVECMSLPIVSDTEQSDKAEQILHWWGQIEQKSIELSLDFAHVYHTDITDCYGSIYTHSIPWALHGKEIAKKETKCNKLLGNQIDCHIRAMSHGQTNGIPQGSVLMDFIAEMVLSYADLLLSERIRHIDKAEFKIIRYRDDYRIFVNNPTIAEEIIKQITEVLIKLGLKLHAGKTVSSNNVIQSSIKSDKIDWIMSKRSAKTIQKQLLVLHKFSLIHQNSGTLTKELQNIYKRIKKTKSIKEKENIPVLISIVVDIAYLNPRTYSIAVATISLLLHAIDGQSAVEFYAKKIMNKFATIPNTSHMQIWLQRAIVKLGVSDIKFDEKICRLVAGESVELWNNEWLNGATKAIISSHSIVDQDILNDMDDVIEIDEVSLFEY